MTPRTHWSDNQQANKSADKLKFFNMDTCFDFMMKTLNFFQVWLLFLRKLQGKFTMLQRNQSSVRHTENSSFEIFLTEIFKFLWINKANCNYYYIPLDFNSLKCSNEFKTFHKTKFKDPTNQHWFQRMPVVWELFPNVVGL